MEFSSPPLDLHTFSSPVDETTRQPTFTTVGSVYNPTASTPLKAPTRRCRTQRYPQAYESPSGDPGINTLLSALSIKDRVQQSPPTTANSLQQYSPLQQNYDRAVSPEAELDLPILSHPAMAHLSMRSGNIPPPETDAIRDAMSKQDTPTLSAEDSMVSEGALQGLSVRTLNNLASYPNKIQNLAKRHLDRGRNAGNNGRVDTPSSFSCESSDYFKDRDGSMYGSNTPTIAGAPPPLTAGPPGQRQYKPSTFEGAVKALSGTVPYTQRVSPAPDYNNYLYDLNMPGADISLRQDFASASTRASTPKDYTSTSVSTEPLSAGAQSRLFRTAMREIDTKIIETRPIEAVNRYYTRGIPGNYNPRVHHTPEDWTENYPLRRQNNLPVSVEDIERRHRETDKKFYSGIDKLHKSIAQIELEHEHKAFQKKLGVIGGERQRAKALEPHPMTVRDACCLEDAVHAEPLLNMAYATLLSYQEDECFPNAWRSGFVKAEAHLIDTAPNANSSFFDQPKRKKTKKVRRGY